jgi:DNA-binding MarR family transcriptional regulator
VSVVETDRELLLEQALEAQHQMGHVMVAWAATDPIWSKLELTMSQLKALVYLGPGRPLTVGQLARALDIGRPAASILVDHLVDLDFVERSEDPEDRRRTFVRLTANAEEMFMHFRQGRRELLLEALNRLSIEDLVAFVQGVSALNRAAAGDQSACSAIISIPEGQGK